MERLTAYNSVNHKNVAYYPACFQYPCEGCGCKIDGCKLDYEVCQKRASYEDTGLEPEEIYEVRFLIAAQRDPQKLARLRELVLADQDGRLVVLPCKVGDTVYTTHWWKDVKEKCTDSNGKPFYRMVSKKIIKKEQFDPFGPHYEWLGKTVFLTREEAEAALAQEGGTHEADSV